MQLVHSDRLARFREDYRTRCVVAPIYGAVFETRLLRLKRSPVGWAKRSVPTRSSMVGTLRFAHPTAASATAAGPKVIGIVIERGRLIARIPARNAQQRQWREMVRIGEVGIVHQPVRRAPIKCELVCVD